VSGTERLSPNRQLAALLRLRWQMVRSTRTRWVIAGVAVIPPVMVIAGLFTLQSAPDDQRLGLGFATPTFYLGFAILTMIAPLVAGGGYELFPSGHLVGYPVRPETVYRSTLLLAPINLAWALNVIALLVVTAFAAGDPALVPTARTLLVVAVFVAAATILGHAFGWVVVGVRQTRMGRLVTNVLGVSVVVFGFMLVKAGLVITLLETSPTTQALDGALAGYRGDHERWLWTLAVLFGIAAAMVKVGDRAAAWALRRPGDHADRTSSRPIARRPSGRSPLAALIAMDHASVWRSTPLRRGVLVMVLVPGAVAALAGMTWQSLILVPGLIAAGAGLLFGINAFTLDSSGSVWLSTMPGWADPAFVAKSIVFAEIAVAAVLSALLGGSLRAKAPTSAAEVSAALASAVCCALIVVAMGMRTSLRHPHRADLQESRDTPASPGVMAAQSLRFAAVTTVTSLYFAALALADLWLLPLVGAVPVVAMAAIHWSRTKRAWEHPYVRANVVLTVAGG
jgi:hypothetical protein